MDDSDRSGPPRQEEQDSDVELSLYAVLKWKGLSPGGNAWIVSGGHQSRWVGRFTI